jgi:hypothetical protein
MIEQEMIELRGKIEGPYQIASDTKMHGMFTGPVTVKPGATLILHGMITADLFVESGAKAIIHGMVNGCVWNRGGDVTVHGTVDNAATDPGANTIIMPKAVVRNA